jgi:DNA uptake protein ComE-like DNA-binding protein
MARGHWLDPLARSLLVATGQLPPPPPPEKPVEALVDSLAEPAASAARGNTHDNSHDNSDENASQNENDHLERDLLELKLRQNPGLRFQSAAEVRHAAALGWRLDVNRATAADWQRLPGISASQVDLLLRLQRGGVQLSGPDDLQRLLELPADQVASWQPLLLFRWYGEGAPATARPLAVDLNRAAAGELQRQLPQLDDVRRQRLLRERQRCPYRDLADLQERLQLPPALVEELIGKVRFGQGPAGPDLPRPA